MAEAGAEFREDVAESKFVPPLGLGHPHAQSILCSAGPRRPLARLRFHALRAKSRAVTLYCGGGTRLTGEFTPAKEHKGLVVVIHGWLGSANSAYVLSLARRLHDHGYSTFRLNLRDHGGSEHLNRELFLSTRLTEAVLAVAAARKQFDAPFLAVVGFSLGGNFALRIGLKAPEHDLHVDQTVAICPPVDPLMTSNALETGPRVYHNYFLGKWKRCMVNKLRYFPHIGKTEDFIHFKTLDQMNRHFITRYSEYDTLVDYFQAYALIGDALSGLKVKSHIIASRDDPVIPIGGFAQVAKSPLLTVEIKPRGGHCGFLNDYLLNSWVDRRVPEILAVE